MSIATIGVIHGRFQALHNGHMEYLLAGKSRCQLLYVGITNPDPGLTAYTQTNPSRSLPMSNPFNYYERLEMLRESLLEAGVEKNEFRIVPFPINFPDLLKHYVPFNARFFVTIYDSWGREKQQVLESLGLEVDVMWERDVSERLTSGTEVRHLIATDQKWDHLVPPAVYNIITNKGLDTRIKQILITQNEPQYSNA